jgi:hypothetical protein
MIQHEPVTGLAEPTAAELEAQLLAAPPRPAVRPLPTVQPRAKKARTSQAAEDGYYYDVNDGTIKEEPRPQAPERPTPAVTYQAPARDWD